MYVDFLLLFTLIHLLLSMSRVISEAYFNDDLGTGMLGYLLNTHEGSLGVALGIMVTIYLALKSPQQQTLTTTLFESDQKRYHYHWTNILA